uniref:Transcription termination factor 3, mitochondrial n=1 Tax=Phallusia mammillata TaxID=59560 RepID=A0A6F9DM49_9ASCI|nr:transcription termination factor 3, mitochondrial [Phallusia mammillata]
MAQRAIARFGLSLIRRNLKPATSYNVCKKRSLHNTPTTVDNSLTKSYSYSTEGNNPTSGSEESASDEPFENDEVINDFMKFDEELKEKLKTLDSVSIPRKSDSLADYVNSSKVLQTLVMFGVELYTIEKQFKEALDFLVKLDLNRDVVPKLQFLKKNKLTPQEFGATVTKNPHILDPQNKIEDFEEMIEYLRSKKFTSKQIASLLVRYPKFLTLSVPKIDGILGFYQKLPTNFANTIYFSGNQLRSLIIRCPSLLTADLEAVFLNIKLLEQSFGFSLPQIKNMVTIYPNLLLLEMKELELRCRLFLFEMELTKEELSQAALVFNNRRKRTETRHYYLKSLGRNQYKPDQKGYLSMLDVVVGTDEEFCEKCKVGTIEDYERFLKTI